MQNGIAQQHFNVSHMKKLNIFYFSIVEQERILEVIANVDKTINNCFVEKRKRIDEKKGLLSDLLSGQKRLL